MSRSEARKTVICPCHDVTVGDIEHAIAEGHTDPETIKRATAVYMGACQGKFCSPLVQQILAEHGIERVGQQRRPAARLPVMPIPLGALIAPQAPISESELDGTGGELPEAAGERDESEAGLGDGRSAETGAVQTGSTRAGEA